MSLIRVRVLAAWWSVVLLVGCAAPMQAPVDLSADYFVTGKTKPGRIGVVMSTLPKPDTEFPGAGCLLCIGVANAAHSSLTKQVQALTTEELKSLPADVTQLLAKRGLDAVAIAEPIEIDKLPDLKLPDPTNRARKDFSALRARHKVDRLLVVHVTALGVWRSYSAYVPTDVPRAVFYGNASIVDLGSHVLEWYLPIAVSRAADGAWDEPPKFPGLTNAYYQAIESGMDQIKKPLQK